MAASQEGKGAPAPAHEGKMNDLSRLLCAVGGHVAEAGATWNNGYAFSRCRRCEREIVRSLFGRWRLPPSGYRVVWRRALPLADDHRRAPMPSVAPGVDASPSHDFMDDNDPHFRWTAAAPPEPPAAAEIPEVYDFMRDEPLPPRVQGAVGARRQDAAR